MKSPWALLLRYYEAKKVYYTTEKTQLTDQEFDALERSIVTIYGEKVLESWGCVGYDPYLHQQVRDHYEEEMDNLKEGL